MDIHSHTQKSSPLHGAAVVGSIVERSFLQSPAAGKAGDSCDIVEFRADAFPDAEALILEAMRACPVPALLTARCPKEGGINALAIEARRDLLCGLLPAAALVDVETANFPNFPEVIREARRAGIPVVASRHDFSGTPPLNSLLATLEEARELGADAAKFAVTLRAAGDLKTLIDFMEQRPPDFPVSVMGMGDLAAVSRLLMAKLGSCLNYGWLDRPTVPGQWAAARLRAVIRELRGE